MIKGTTPTFILTIDDANVDLTEATVYVTFKQDGDGCRGLSLTKTGDDITVSANEVDVYLTQAETLKFQKGQLYIQLNWVYADGSRACSDIKAIKVDKNLIEAVL